jgi:hypothetical protein
VVVLAMLCVVYPLASYAWPPIGRAWGMYASTTFYRMRMVGTRRDGTDVDLSPDASLASATPRVAAALIGSERGRHGSVLSLPDHLDDVASHACRPELRAVAVTLEVRTLSSDQVDRYSSHVECSP